MRSTSWDEIDYLSSIDGKATRDDVFMQEMSRQLDALRCFDQLFCDADWRPRPDAWRSAPPRKASRHNGYERSER